MGGSHRLLGMAKTIEYDCRNNKTLVVKTTKIKFGGRPVFKVKFKNTKHAILLTPTNLRDTIRSFNCKVK